MNLAYIALIDVKEMAVQMSTFVPSEDRPCSSDTQDSQWRRDMFTVNIR